MARSISGVHQSFSFFTCVIVCLLSLFLLPLPLVSDAHFGHHSFLIPESGQKIYGPRRSLRAVRNFGVSVARKFPGNITAEDRLALAIRYEQLAYLMARLLGESKKIERLEARLTKFAGGKPYAGFEATSDEWWVDVIKRDWKWHTIDNVKNVPGSFLLSDTTSYSCMLVLKDVCHFNYDRGDGGLGGYWYSRNKYDLSRLAQTRDICGWSKRFNRDAAKEIDRAQIKEGEFLSHEKYLELSIPPNKTLKKDIPIWKIKRGMAAPHDSFPGHFIERVGSLAELAASLANSLNRSRVEPIFGDLTVQFGANIWIRTFGRGVANIIFGDLTKYIAGKKRPGNAHVCFDEVIFPLNEDYLGAIGNERFKENSYKLVTQTYVNVPQPPKMEPNYQVTWLWRSSSRTIINAPQVLRLSEKVFSGIPIQMVEFAHRQPLVEVVDVMRRTAFTFGMHGAAFANEIFLPSGSVALELLPWKMRYLAYFGTGQSFGVRWAQWANRSFRDTAFANNCFQSLWMDWSVEACLMNQSCYHCIKNYSNTRVNLQELEEKLREFEPQVREWIALKQNNQ